MAHCTNESAATNRRKSSTTQLPPPSAPRPSESWKGWHFLMVAIVTSIVTAFVVALTYTIWIENRHRKPPVRTKVCNSLACRRYSGMIITRLDKGADPCRNFYEFVCGRNVMEKRRGVYSDHIYAFIKRSAQLLSMTLVPSRQQTAAQKAAGFYQTCEDITLGNMNEIIHFKNILKSAGLEWPHISQQHDVFNSLIAIHRALGITTLLVIQTEPTENDVYLMPEPWLFAYHDQRNFKRQTRTWESYYNTVRSEFLGSSNDSFLSFAEFTRIEEIILGTLLTVLVPGRFEALSLLNSTQELSSLTRGISPQHWNHILYGLMGLSNAKPVRSHVSLRYIQAFSNLFISVGEQNLVYVTGWLVVQRIAYYISSDIAAAWYGSRKAAIQDTALRCIKLTEHYMGWATFLPIVDRIFTRDIMEEIHTIMRHLLDALRPKLEGNLLTTLSKEAVRLGAAMNSSMKLLEMKPATIESHYAKIADMENFVSTNWLNAVASLRAADEAVLMTVVAIGVSYELYFAGTMLPLFPYAATLPLYDYNISKSVKYGGLGSVLARALFALTGENLNANGQRKLDCYILESRLPNSTAPGLRKWKALRWASLDVLWNAFQAATEEKERDPPGGLADFTLEQLFFIAFCYIRCDQRDALAEYDCNEPLRRNVHFSEAFKCPAGSAMNYEDNCGFL
ncbi:neprilysin-1-like [Ornithodoros turicata]|uniref:neprilysin-1-like n=1 Tax=Ornithodoros turicata TaxID=34597 RepID=UPI003138D0E5